ncbi:hypothetical protein V1478_006699 [Vespula squamosa]|uniref:Uncharacterized protein n=1 Tax=Vespula squamosa TaxID=30214 RepID=A0ABD2B0L8_VESSQ
MLCLPPLHYPKYSRDASLSVKFRPTIRRYVRGSVARRSTSNDDGDDDDDDDDDKDKKKERVTWKIR